MALWMAGLAASGMILSGCSAGASVPAATEDCAAWNSLSESDREQWAETTDVAVPPTLTFYADDGGSIFDGDPVGLLTAVCGLPGDDIPSLSLAEAFDYQTSTLTCSDWMAAPQMGKDGWTAGFSAWTPADDTTEVVAAIESVCAIPESSGLLLRDLALNPAPPVEEGGSSPVADVILTDTWTDDIGYTYSFELQRPQATVASDALNAKPGYVLIDWMYTSLGELSNQTPDRNAPLPSLQVQPIWSSSTALCAYASPDDHNFRQGLSYPDSDNEDQWCTLAASLEKLHGPDTIDVDGSAPVENTGTRNQLEVPEDLADALIADLKAPTGWVLGRDRSNTESGLCSIDMGTTHVGATSVEAGCE